MNIKEFKVIATFEKEMTIKIDTDKIDEKWMQDFSSYMFFVDTHEALCQHIAHNILFNGDDFPEVVGKLSQWNQAEDLKEKGFAISNVNDLSEEFDVEERK